MAAAANDRTAILRLRTPEGVTFPLALASPLLRMAAATIDTMVVLATWGLVATLVRLVELVSADLSRGVAIISMFVLSLGYRIGAEWMWNGQSLGKRVLKLRVVDARGLKLGLAQIVIRNLLRFIDALPFAYAVGGACALINRRGQRLGDLVAGTVVIWESTEVAPDVALLGENKYNSLRGHAPLVARLRQSISPVEVRIAWSALLRRDTLEDGARIELFAELSAHFQAAAKFPEDLVEGLSDEQLVRNVVDVVLVSRG